MKQILFYDIKEYYTLHAGILLDNGDCICGCCGEVYKHEDHGKTWKIVKEYLVWMDIEEAICGDEEDIIELQKI